MRRIIETSSAGLLLLVLTFTNFPVAVSAQAELGSILGTVTDQSDAVLPGATISVTNLETGQVRTTVTNAGGRYQVAALQPSQYRVEATIPGFAGAARDAVTVNIGSLLDINFQLSLSSFEESVTVTGEVPLVESSKTELSYVIGKEQLETLPSKSRQYLDFVLLTPMTVENVSTSSQGSGLNLGGSRSKETALLVDGFYNMDEGFALPKQRHSQDSIQEFQVVSFGGSAEHGRAIGGIVNAITKSGGNRFAGTGYGFFRATPLNAQDPGQKARGTEKTEFDRQQWGGTLGGPVVRDKTFFFGAYERVSEDFPFDNGITEENAAIIGLPAEDVGTVPRYYRNNFVMGKVDHNLNDSHRVQANVAMSRWTEFNIVSPNAFGARSNQQRLAATDWTVSGKWIGIYDEGRVVHEAKASYFPRYYETAGPNAGGPPLCDEGCVNTGLITNSSPPRVVINNVASFGQSAFSAYIDTIPFQVIYNSSFFAESHSVKFGVDYQNSLYDLDFVSQLQGNYVFNSLDDYLAGRYSRFTQGFGQTSNPRRHQYVSAFIQDSWAMGDRLTMNYGLRYDLEIHPKHPGTGQRLGNDYTAFGPRFALSYDLSGQGTTFFKLSSGIYVDRLYQRLSTPYTQVKGFEQIQSATWLPDTPGAPSYPEVFAQTPPDLPSAGIINAWILPDELKTPRSAQVVGTFERSLSSSLSFSTSLVYSRSWNKEYQWDTNLEFDTALQGWSRPDPSYRQITQYRFGGEAEYLGGIFELTKRGRRVGFSGNVTFSRAYDSGNSGDNYPNDQVAGVEADWGPTADTPVVRGVINGWYNVAEAMQLSAVFRARTGMAVDATAAGLDLNGDGRFNDRTPTFGRNSFRAPGNNSLDIRFTWSPPIGDAKLAFYLEGFNILNSENIRAVNDDFGPDSASPKTQWMNPLSYFPPREVQIGARLTF